MMTPSPLNSSQQQKQDEYHGEMSCDVSRASSSGCIDDIIDFDPDAVDFEPLLVSGTGKILSYHSASYYEDEDGSGISLSSSVMTPVVKNGNGIRSHDSVSVGSQNQNSLQIKSKPRSYSRLVQALTFILLAAFMVMGGLSWFASDVNYASSQLETTVTKNTGGAVNSLANNIILQQHIMDAEIAASKASQIVFWEPYLDRYGKSANNALIDNTIAIMSQCFGRTIFKLQMGESYTYQLHQLEIMQPQQPNVTTIATQQQTPPPPDLPMAVFTTNFKQAGIQLFDHFNPGAFITILHDPYDIYLAQYTNTKGEKGPPNNMKNKDNLLVRHLSGMDDMNRGVTDADYHTAKEVLKAKFIIGSCENPTETLRRLVHMLGNTGRGIIGSESCTKMRQSWNLECRRMRELGQKGKENRRNQKILSKIKEQNHYDIRLYEASKNFFNQQNALFR